MEVYQLNSQLKILKEKPFKLEKDLQRLFEENLEQLTGLELVRSEFTVEDKRIDTLAYDKERQAFVIIEYKRSSNYSVFDQGVSYLNKLLRHKADFILEYQEKCQKPLKRADIDWSQSRIIFVAPTFTTVQKQAIDFKDLNIELLEVKRFENNVLVINSMQGGATSPSIKQSSATKSDSLSEITKELKSYTEEEHLANKSDDLVELYQEFRQAILQLSADIKVFANKKYIAFKLGQRNIIDIEVQKGQLKLFLNAKWGQLDDSKNLARNVSQIGKFGNGDYEIKVTDTKDLEYIMSLVKQVVG